MGSLMRVRPWGAWPTWSGYSWAWWSLGPAAWVHSPRSHSFTRLRPHRGPVRVDACPWRLSRGVLLSRHCGPVSASFGLDNQSASTHGGPSAIAREMARQRVRGEIRDLIVVALPDLQPGDAFLVDLPAPNRRKEADLETASLPDGARSPSSLQAFRSALDAGRHPGVRISVDQGRM